MILALLRGLDESLLSGRILVDGVDTRTISLKSLRQALRYANHLLTWNIDSQPIFLSLVAQDPFLWHASIRENLDPEGLVEEKDVWAALTRVGMHEAVAALPEGVDAVLEDEGSLSKGQRQLLCLARVLLRKRKIVILDEASSRSASLFRFTFSSELTLQYSLDLETDEKMREVIRTELAGSTVLAVAHRICESSIKVILWTTF